MDTDVIVIGAGIAGATAAHALGQRGLRVVLVDAKDPCPPTFKAEKMWPGNLEIFRRFGLEAAALSVATPIRSVLEARAGHVLATVQTGEYGMYYQDLVNALRRDLPPSARLHIARVADIAPGPETQRVTFAGGESLDARLIVFAAGTASPLATKLGFDRRSIRDGQSTGFGFDIARDDGGAFPFEALTYAASGFASRIGYITFFPIGSIMRANMFVFRSPKDEWVRRMIRQPHDTLCEALPGLEKVLGAFTVPGRVETAGIDLYRVENAPELDGIVLAGDAYQGVCPSTGTGFDKVLGDIDVLCTAHVPRWFETPGMARDKIATFYADPKKQQVDRYSLQKAHYERWAATSPSWSAGLHRTRIAADMYLAALRKSQWLWSDRTYVQTQP